MTHPIPQLVYNPNNLLNAVMQQLQVRSDGALAQQLKIARNVISGIRKGRLPVPGTILLTIAQETEFSIEQLRSLLGDRRSTLRLQYGAPAAPAVA